MNFMLFLASLIFITFVFPIVILPLFSLDNFNKVYEFIKPPSRKSGHQITIIKFKTKKVYEYIVINTRFGKTEYLNLDTGEVQWQDSFKEF